MIRPASKQHGVALITVLLIFAVLTLIAVEIASATYFDIRRTGNHVVHAQAYQYALGGEAYARQLLFQDFQAAEEGKAIDHLKEPWAERKKAFDFEQGRLEVSIRDAQAGFNLNNVIDAQGQPDKLTMGRAERLFGLIHSNGQTVNTLLDWLDKDIIPRGVDTEDEGYLALDKAYRTANGPMVHSSELSLLQGLDQKDMELLQNYISLLPGSTAINVNTASANVLSLLHPALSVVQAEGLIAAREESAFDSVEEFLKQEALAGIELTGDGISVNSQYFRIYVKAGFAGQTVWLTSLVHRDQEKGFIRLISRDKNSRFDFSVEEHVSI